MKSNKLYLQNIGFFMIVAFLCSALTRVCRFHGDERIFRLPDITLHDTIYYVGESASRVFLTLALYTASLLFSSLMPYYKTTKTVKIIASALLMLAVGKLLDEYIGPYVWSNFEKAFDIFVFIISAYKFKKLWNSINKTQRI